MKPMVMARRGFLRAFGIGAVSGPLAAKVATDAEIAKLVGAATGSSGVGLPGGNAYAPPSPNGAEQYIPYEQRVIGAGDFVKAFGLPAAVERQLRDQATYCSQLDPDIACKVSWSMSVKFATQRQRNYERLRRRIEEGAPHQRALATVKTMLGFDWLF